MSNLKKLYLALTLAIVAIFGFQSDASAPTRAKKEVEKPEVEKKFRAPFLPKK